MARSGQQAPSGRRSEPKALTASEREAALARSKKRKAKRERQRKLKMVGKILAIIGLVLTPFVLAYFIGVFYFSRHLMPGTVVCGEDLGGAKVSEAATHIESSAGAYDVTLEGSGFSLVISGNEIGYRIDAPGAVAASVAQSPKWLWFVHLKDERTLGVDGFAQWDNDQLLTILQFYVEEHNWHATEPEDAYITFSDEADNFVIIPEIEGNLLDLDAVVAATTDALNVMSDTVEVGDDLRVRPAMYKDTEQLVDQLAAAKAQLGADFDIFVTGDDFWTEGERVVDHIGNAVLAQWIILNEDGTVRFDEEAMREWCAAYAEDHRTFGKSRYYWGPEDEWVETNESPDTSFGWKYDAEAFATGLIQHIDTRSKTRLEVPDCTQTAVVWTTLDKGTDFGDTYIDVTISSQIVRYYIDGELVWEADTVSGDMNSGQGTPYGTFFITKYKRHGTHLKGRNPDGTDYDVPVEFWMPFIGDLVGFHDNPNRTIFGWPWAFRDAGSHGCCNLPYSKAQSLFATADKGTPVIVHW